LADVRQADFSTVTGGIRLRGATFDQFTVFPPEQAWSGDPEAEGMVYAPALAGDANLDDQVTFADFLLLSKSFGVSCVDTDLEWDFDLDGGVGFTDFLLLSDSFSISRVVGTQAVPEPLCTMTLTGIILACVALRLRGSR
jgi:hypothetical protein